MLITANTSLSTNTDQSAIFHGLVEKDLFTPPDAWEKLKEYSLHLGVELTIDDRNRSAGSRGLVNNLRPPTSIWPPSGSCSALLIGHGYGGSLTLAQAAVMSKSILGIVLIDPVFPGMDQISDVQREEYLWLKQRLAVGEVLSRLRLAHNRRKAHELGEGRPQVRGSLNQTFSTANQWNIARKELAASHTFWARVGEQLEHEDLLVALIQTQAYLAKDSQLQAHCRAFLDRFSQSQAFDAEQFTLDSESVDAHSTLMQAIGWIRDRHAGLGGDEYE